MKKKFHPSKNDMPDYKRTFFSSAYEYVCPVCGKSFVPAPYHVYQEQGKPYCSWSCYRSK